MIEVINYIQAHWLDWLHGAGAGILTWIGAGWVAAPLKDFLTDRRHAIEAVQEYGSFNSFLASEQLANAARDALSAAATRMLYYAQGGPAVVRIYSWVRRYNVQMAGRALNGLVSLIVSGQKPPDYQGDAVRVCLGAARLIPPDRRRVIRRLLREAVADSGTIDLDRIT